MFRLEAPAFLLLAIPVLAAVALLHRRRRRGDVRLDLPDTGARLRFGRSPWVLVDDALPWIRGLGLLLLVASAARPQSGAAFENTSTLGVDIAVALDVSGSMSAQDFEPDRLTVAKRTVERFVAGRSPDRIGLVVFARLATTRCPLTLDHEMLREFLDEVTLATRDQDGTALGMGLATAVNRLRESDARSKIVVLVTDGVNNTGQIAPRAAAEAARALGVRVYTIGVGSEGEALIPVDMGALGTRLQRHRVELDEALLREIAESTGGRYFRATDSAGLQEIFDTIDELEKTVIESRIRVLYSELFRFTLVPGLALLLLERLLAATRLRRLP